METTPNTNTTMFAAVCKVCRRTLCVCDLENGQEVLIVIGESLNEAEIRQRLRSTIMTG